jgi:hypothetical protein
MFNRLAIQLKVMVISCRNRPASATLSLDRPARSVHQQICSQMRQCQCQDQANIIVNVTGLLRVCNGKCYGLSR